jgi:hypothetical protein
MEVYCIDMNTYNIMSQVELNKTIINCYFEAYNNKNEWIRNEGTEKEPVLYLPYVLFLRLILSKYLLYFCQH